MPVLGVVLLLAVSVASLPCWSYSRRWGFVPSATSAVLLFFAALTAVGGKPAESQTTQNASSVKPVSVASAPGTTTPAPKPASPMLDRSRQPIPLLRASASTLSGRPDGTIASQ